MNETWTIDKPTDPTHAARVRLLAAGIAQQIMAIPADVSKHSRAIRISKIRDRVMRFQWRMSETSMRMADVTVIKEDRRLRNAWIEADIAAWRAVRAAMAAGEPLTGFLFPSEQAAAS